jgi:hypothetical protein
MGLNEFAGYFAVGVVAFLTGIIAEKYGVTLSFYLGIGISIVGFFALLLSKTLVILYIKKLFLVQ